MPIPSHAHDQEEWRLRRRHLMTPEQQEQRHRYRLAAALALVWTGLMLTAELTGVLEELTLPLVDWQMALAGAPPPADEDLGLLEIDRIPSDRPWPWARLDYALVLRSVMPFAPQSVVLEMLLNDRDTQYSAFDSTFANVVHRFDHLVFAAAVVRINNDQAPPKNFDRVPAKGPIRELPLFQGLLWPLETFAGDSPVGIRNLPTETTGEVRRLPLVFRVKDQLTPSLALQALAQRLGGVWSRSVVRLGEAVELRDAQGQLLRRIPVDLEGRLQLRFRTPRALPWTVSFDNVLVYADQMDRGEKVPKDLRELRRRQVWVGRTDRVDFEPVQTALGRMTPVEVQMLAVRQMLDEDYLKPWPFSLVALLFISTALLGSLLAVYWNPLMACVVLGTVGVAMFVGSTWWFRTENYNGPLLTFFLLLLGTWVAGLAANRWDVTEKVEEDKNQLPLDLS